MEINTAVKGDGLFGRSVHLKIKGDEHEIAKAVGEMLKDKEVQAVLLKIFMASHSGATAGVFRCRKCGKSMSIEESKYHSHNNQE